MKVASKDIKILAVDDREDNLFSIETILEKNNYTIVKANSGRAALKILLHQHDFSLILMDVQMPDINGLETANIIYQRDKLKDIPIIFITAHNYDDDLVFKGYKLGAVDYIYKPINPELLKAKVEVFVELFRKNQQLIEHEKELLAINTSLQNEIEERKLSEEKIKLLNTQLLINNENLKTVNEELDRFAYVASHDLQEPLRKIMIFSDKILMADTKENVNRYLQKIVSSSQRMQSLIQDLLHFSRQNITPSDFTKSDLNIIVKEALHELEMEIEKTKASIHVEKLPVLYIIPSLIRQLFYNLLNNAIKFRRSDLAPSINIQLSSKKINSITYSLINVQDNGIGFDPKYKEDIFSVFKRLHSYHDFEGSGVGLSICKKIIEKHNGFINAESIPGEGSNFIIALPNV
ncbi:response regulator [Panacibacter ginsenosidivorans]|uniref:histidine kinase n=1 Tax=Panacibacter ginsenosidivorans TaxID=1813871 RepID=A0A5B8VC81_9BACT|nr:response regulator [Panacibacter ginsenosidivorans]QEC68889.1 response regulator [Panacibacter ginsenosidivorans]